MAESTLHADALIDLRVNLRTATSHLPRTYTGLDQLINYDKHNRSLVLAPDIYVLTHTDIKPGDNVKSIRTWEQGVPIFVLELISDSSLKRDLVHKLRIYARMGVAEYLVWDPLEEHLTPKIRYYRLSYGVYEEQKLEKTETGEPSVTLAGLPVRLLCDGYRIRVQSTETGELFQSAEEAREQRMALEIRTRELNRQLQEESVRADAERQRAEAERLRAEAALQRVNDERQRAEAERQRADAERQRADAERQRADAQALELANLRALLARLTPGESDQTRT